MGSLGSVVEFWNLNNSACPHAQKTWITMEEKGIKYEQRFVDKANKSKEFTDLYHSIWPDAEKNSVVPILVDTDGTKLTESLLITEYLDAKYPQKPQLVPSDPAAAAKARLFIEIFDANFNKLRPLIAAQASEVDERKAAAVKGLKVLDAYLQKSSSNAGPWLLDAYSLAENISAPFVRFLDIVLKEFKKTSPSDIAQEAGLPRLQEWLEAVLARPSTQNTGPKADFVSEYAEKNMGAVRV